MCKPGEPCPVGDEAEYMTKYSKNLYAKLSAIMPEINANAIMNAVAQNMAMDTLFREILERKLVEATDLRSEEGKKDLKSLLRRVAEIMPAVDAMKKMWKQMDESMGQLTILVMRSVLDDLNWSNQKRLEHKYLWAECVAADPDFVATEVDTAALDMDFNNQQGGALSFLLGGVTLQELNDALPEKRKAVKEYRDFKKAHPAANLRPS